MNKTALFSKVLNLLGKSVGAAGAAMDSLPGTAAFSALGEMDNITKALTVPRAQKIKFNPGIRLPSTMGGGLKLSSAEGSNMKTLKDVLVEKIAAKLTADAAPTEKRASLGFTVTDEDVKFFDKIAQVPPQMATNWLPDIAQKAMGPLAVAGLAGMGLSAASGVYGELRDYVKREMAYKQMFEEFPALKDAPRETVDKYWGVLNDFAPAMTVNPLVAGQFVENMMNYGQRGIDHNTAAQLIDSQAKSRNAGGIADMSKAMAGLGTAAFNQGANVMGSMSETDPGRLVI